MSYAAIEKAIHALTLARTALRTVKNRNAHLERQAVVMKKKIEKFTKKPPRAYFYKPGSPPNGKVKLREPA